MLRSPQNLVLPSTGTTSLEQNQISAGWAWCFTPRKTLFFRRRAPRLWDKMGLRPVERGASLPAMPCSFVDGHHVFGAKSDFSRLGVVLRSPQCLVLPSSDTTSLEQNRISAGWAWCFAPRKTLFFRRRAPRQHAYPNEKHASGKKSQFKLTLMKGDKVVYATKYCANLLCFALIRWCSHLNLSQIIRIYCWITCSCAVIQNNLYEAFALNKAEQKIPVNIGTHLCVSSRKNIVIIGLFIKIIVLLIWTHSLIE